MFWTAFLLRIVCALGLGAAIGAERQLRQRMAGLRTNALVSVGACLFVLLTELVPDFKHDGAGIPAQVVSGIGFLGAGVIMRDGLSVRGLNTAATLWCAAAIGVLCGLGFTVEAGLGTLVVLCANILLREVAQRINHQPVAQAEVELPYRLRIVCREEDEVRVRALTMSMLSAMPLSLQALQSRDLAQAGRLEVCADLVSLPANQGRLEEIVARVSQEKGVSAVSWKRLDDGEVLSSAFTLAVAEQ